MTSKSQTVIVPDVRKLIGLLTGLKEGDENFIACEKYVLSNLWHHTNLSVNSHDVRRSLEGMALKFMVHGHMDYSSRFDTLYKKFLASPEFKDHEENDIQWSLLSLLLHMAYKPTSVVNNVVDSPAEVKEKTTKTIDWPKLLCEGNEFFFNEYGADSGDESSCWSSELEKTKKMAARDLQQTPAAKLVNVVAVTPPSQACILNVEYINERARKHWLSKYKQQEEPWWNKDKIHYRPSSKHRSASLAFLMDEVEGNEVSDRTSTLSEYKVLREVLWNLICPTDTFLFTQSKGKYVVRPNTTIPSLSKGVFKKVLSHMCIHFDIIKEFQKFQEDLYQDCNDDEVSLPPHTYEAYFSGISKFLVEFKTAVIEEETKVMEHETQSTLISVKHNLDTRLKQLRLIYNVHKNATRYDWRKSPNWLCASCLLSVLYEEIKQSPPSAMSAFLLTVFLESFRPYLLIVDQWLTEGELRDTRSEFVISNNVNCTTPVCDLWKGRLYVHPYVNTLSDAGIKPVALLQAVIDKVLHAGKSMQILLELDRLSQIRKLMATSQDTGELFGEFLEQIEKDLSAYVLEDSPGEEGSYDDAAGDDDDGELGWSDINGKEVVDWSYLNESVDDKQHHGTIILVENFRSPTMKDVLSANKCINSVGAVSSTANGSSKMSLDKTSVEGKVCSANLMVNSTEADAEQNVPERKPLITLPGSDLITNNSHAGLKENKLQKGVSDKISSVHVFSGTNNEKQFRMDVKTKTNSNNKEKSNSLARNNSLRNEKKGGNKAKTHMIKTIHVPPGMVLPGTTLKTNVVNNISDKGNTTTASELLQEEGSSKGDERKLPNTIATIEVDRNFSDASYPMKELLKHNVVKRIKFEPSKENIPFKIPSFEHMVHCFAQNSVTKALADQFCDGEFVGNRRDLLSPSIDNKGFISTAVMNLLQECGVVTLPNCIDEGKVVDYNIMYKKLVSYTSHHTVPTCPVMEQSLSSLVDKKYSVACKTLMAIFHNEFQLSKHFHFIRSVYLMEAGHLMHRFYTQIFRGAGRRKWTSYYLTDRLQNCIDPCYPDMSVHLLLSMGGTSADASVLGMISDLQLSYNVDWPLNVILSEKIIERYNSVFKFLLKIKWSLWYLQEMKLTAGSDEYDTTVRLRVRRLQLLRFWLLHAVSSIHVYVVGQVLHGLELRLKQEMEAAEDLSSLLDAHSTYVDNVYRLCLQQGASNALCASILQLFNLTTSLGEVWPLGPRNISDTKLQEMENTFTKYYFIVGMILRNMVESGIAPYLSSLCSAFSTLYNPDVQFPLEWAS